jgi:endogenous inhibitor of DNA gyrase (YacG/DUF329 family)
MEMRNCLFCNKEFKMRRRHHIFCSPQCRLQYFLQKKKIEIDELKERLRKYEEG